MGDVAATLTAYTLSWAAASSHSFLSQLALSWVSVCSVALQYISSKQTGFALATPAAVLSFPRRHLGCSPSDSIIFIDSDYHARECAPSQGQLESTGASWIEGEQHR